MTIYEAINAIKRQGIKSLNPDDCETLEVILKKLRFMLKKHDCKKIIAKNINPWGHCYICGKGGPRIEYK